MKKQYYQVALHLINADSYEVAVGKAMRRDVKFQITIRART